MRALPASLPVLWVLAATAFSNPVQAQTPQRTFQPFMHPPEFTCSAKTSQLRMDLVDEAALKILEKGRGDFGEDKKQSELPRVTLSGVTATVGGAVRLANAFNIVEDASIAWMNQMVPATKERDGIEEQTHVVKKSGQGYILRVYQDSSEGLGQKRDMASPLKENIEGFKATATFLLIEARELAKRICNQTRAQHDFHILDKRKFLSSFVVIPGGFQDTFLDPIRKKFSLLLDFAGAAREGGANPPPLAPEQATLTRQAMYILGLSNDVPEKFGPEEKGLMQAALTKETGMKISKTGKPDRKVGPLTARAAWQFLQKAYNGA